MREFILNPDIEPRPYTMCGAEKLGHKLAYILKEAAKSKDYTLLSANYEQPRDMNMPQRMTLGFFDNLAVAYSAHRSIELDPKDLWFIVLCELADYIKNNPEQLRSLFTKEKGKVTILVPTADHAQIDLLAVLRQLRDLVPLDVDLFVPKLSTQTEACELAMVAALCDGLQRYYDYMTFMCGIKAIRLLGTPEDWLTLARTAVQLMALFIPIVGTTDKVISYLKSIHQTFIKLSKCYDEELMSKAETLDFLGQIFSTTRVGSGGQLDIDGWISSLYFPRKTKRFENFQNSLAIVPYSNLESGRQFKTIHGAFSNYDADDFIATGYGHFVFEEVETPPEQKAGA